MKRNGTVEKNQIIELEITGMTAEGNGVGRFCGLCVFVPDSAVGDQLKVRIVKVQKNLAYGIIDSVLMPSADRIQPRCPQKQCGGCVWQHISYEAECRAKEQQVTDAFTRIGHITPEQTLPILPAGETEGYRNKAQYPCANVDGAARFGFYAPRSHRLQPVTDCLLQPAVFGEILRRTEALLAGAYRAVTPYDEMQHQGVLRHLYLRRGYHSCEIMLCFVSANKNAKTVKALTALGKQLAADFPDIRSVMLNVNPERTNVILGRETRCLLGSDTISDTLCGVPIRLHPQSFYQVNTAQAERLFAEAKRLLNLQKHETLLDLYCGAGVIGLFMADSVQRVIGVEVVKEAIDDANENAARAGICNAEFFAGDAGEISARLADQQEAPDAIVLDPPRKGCDAVTLDACVQMAPDRIVMISCNPATAARDAAYLAERGYAVKVLRAVDMFPRTRHVECVVLMSRDNG